MRTLVNRDFKFYVSFSAKHWLPVLLLTLLAGALAWGVCNFWMKPTYAAKTTIYIGNNGNFGEAGVPELNVRDLPKDRPVSRETENVRNVVVGLRAGMEMITDLKLLIQTERFQSKVEKKFIEHNGRKPNPYSVDVKNPKDSRFLMLQVVSDYPKEAKELADLMGEVFLDEIEELLGVHNSQIIDYAKMPTVPIYPRTKIIVMVTSVLVALGTLFLFFFFYFLDSRLSGVEDLQSAISLPVLGEIPLDNLLLQEIEKSQAQHHIVSTLDAKNGVRHANISEAFRMLRNNVRYTDTKKNDAEGRVLTITSSVPGEGKSFIASNLAVSFAELGYRTLIINCDLHKAMFHKVFGIVPKGGLVDILSSGERFENCVLHHYMDLPLDILPCGPTPPNPAKLLDSAELKALLVQLKKQYQYIFLDAPPISAVADTTILGKLADGAILVVRDRYTREEALSSAIKQLSLVDVEIFGIIMNGSASRRKDYYGHDYDYGYGYGYGYGSAHPSRSSKTWRQRLSKIFSKK